MDIEKLVSSITAYLKNRSSIDKSDIGVGDIAYDGSYFLARLKPLHPGIPQLIIGEFAASHGLISATPYYPVNERPDRQIMSYILGQGKANLAEVKEINGQLYSRCCLSYDPTELIHADPAESRIGLWVHDCLTEDLDHHASLNRKMLEGGVCLSFDFGLAFSSRYYPPFYTAELGLEDKAIEIHQPFLLNVLSSYAGHLIKNEQKIMDSVRKTYPQTHHHSLCHYYLENYRSLFSARLRYGRFFDKIKKTPFNPKGLERIADAVRISIQGIHHWDAFILRLSERKPIPMNLRGLHLSDLDLRNAYFNRSDLRQADLSGSNVEGADFRGADLRGANLEGTNMEKAMTEGTLFK